MCGISGIIGKEVPPGTIQRMTQRIAHRGPDAEGYFEEGVVHFGHRRLSILDTGGRGNQPMFDRSGRYVLIHNGEIYNFKQIRRELGFSAGTETDTEVILEAFARWGPDCLHRFAGMWAFAIWDRAEQSLFISRDRMGIKPLYYVEDQGRLLFASEIRALLASGGFRPRVDRAGLGCYLTYQTVYGNGTLIEGVKMMPAGHFGIWKAGRWALHPWWDIWKNALPDGAEMDLASTRKRIRSLLEQSIERRLVSDVPLGAFLSGGIDSSAVVALMACASAQAVDTFSVVFEEEEYDESEWSELMARRYGTRHHPLLLKPGDFLEMLPAALGSMDHPSGDGLNSFVVCQLTRAQGVKVALSGLGGDELFAGYPVFTQAPAILRKCILKLPSPLRRGLAAAYGMLNHGREAAKKQSVLSLPEVSLEEVYKVFRTIYDWEEAKRLMSLPPSSAHPLDGILSQMRSTRQAFPHLSQISGLEISSYTQSVLLRDTDQMSMAHALEVRVPFFDHDLVEFAMGIPDAFKLGSYPKQLLVESLGELLPSSLVHRKKVGFMFPWEKWLRGELRGFCEERIRRFAARGLAGKSIDIDRIWRSYQAGEGPWRWSHIWLPVVLEDWLQRNGIEE
jgi:asparagine synthase (glutamine-hydrolysing)